MRNGPPGTVTQSSDALAGTGRSAGSPSGSNPPSSIAWRIVSVCWSSWRITISWITGSGSRPSSVSRARARTSSRYSRAPAVSSSSISPRTERGVSKAFVARREVGAQQRRAREAVHEPQVLVRGDVREVPYERAQDRVDLALEVGRRKVAHEVERAA